MNSQILQQTNEDIMPYYLDNIKTNPTKTRNIFLEIYFNVYDKPPHNPLLEALQKPPLNDLTIWGVI